MVQIRDKVNTEQQTGVGLFVGFVHIKHNIDASVTPSSSDCKIFILLFTHHPCHTVSKEFSKQNLFSPAKKMYLSSNDFIQILYIVVSSQGIVQYFSQCHLNSSKPAEVLMCGTSLVTTLGTSALTGTHGISMLGLLFLVAV